MLHAGIIAGLLVQNTLKYLLDFGAVTQYLGYNSLKDFFPQMSIKPNPGCANPLCGRLQAAYQVCMEGIGGQRPWISLFTCIF